VVDRALEFPFQQARVLGSDARDKNLFFALDELGGYFQDLLGCFAGAEDDLGKSFAKGAMSVHLSKSEIDNRRGLEGLQHLVAAHSAGSKFLEQLDCFSRRHDGKMRQKSKNPSAKSRGLRPRPGWAILYLRSASNRVPPADKK
jgi:hypothetical protein